MSKTHSVVPPSISTQMTWRSLSFSLKLLYKYLVILSSCNSISSPHCKTTNEHEENERTLEQSTQQYEGQTYRVFYCLLLSALHFHIGKRTAVVHIHILRYLTPRETDEHECASTTHENTKQTHTCFLPSTSDTAL